MGLLQNIFGKKPTQELINADSYFKTLTAYQPVFRSWGGKLYESELVRSAIDARARHISKLKITVEGSARPELKTKLKHAPNEFQTWSQFLYRVSTILDMQNNVFIVPVVGKYGEISGYFPVLPSQCSILQDKMGKAVLKYTFKNRETAACYLEECGIMTKFQYEDDFFGSSNRALADTMSLIDMQNQGIKEAIKNSATYRFMAQMSNFSKAEDIAKERKRFSAENLKADAEGGGILLFPNTYSNIQQIKTEAYTVPADQRALIEKNISDYYAVNEEIIQSKAFGDKLDAFFDSVIEPFMIQLSEVLTKMTFTYLEQSYGAKIVATANRLMYMPMSQKISLAQQFGDRGMISVNEARELINLPPLEGDAGERLPIRGEYYFNGESEGEGDTNNE